uniref:Protein phosphatase 1 regulatory subunit n=1 Tax=Xiphophorus couchianus TaxID=32473 RepID=A0A3B5KWL9_9TELE
YINDSSISLKILILLELSGSSSLSLSVLTSFNPSAMPGPVMTDVAMRFYISHSPARSRSQQLYKPLRPCLSSQRRAADNGAHVAWAKKKPMKKSVVFADTKGLSLTAIHVFSKFDDEPYQNKPISSVRSLALEFKQPSADYLDFRNRLIRNCVSLENCSLQERSLTGTIKVRNVGYEKSVQVRVTYDSWATFSDVDCSFLNNVYGCQDTDTFAFELELPAYTPPQNRIEFCICFRVQGQTYWDNNEGKNYPLKHLDFDQFGSPRMSSGLFPGWQSWGHIDNTVPYW